MLCEGRTHRFVLILERGSSLVVEFWLSECFLKYRCLLLFTSLNYLLQGRIPLFHLLLGVFEIDPKQFFVIHCLLRTLDLDTSLPLRFVRLGDYELRPLVQKELFVKKKFIWLGHKRRLALLLPSLVSDV